MASFGRDEREKKAILDEAKRCEGRMASLVAKIRNARTGQTVLTLIGGGIGASGGVISAALDPKKEATLKTATAGIAAAGALVAVVNQLVGDPATIAGVYFAAVAHYDKAVDIAFVKKDSCEDCVVQIRRELALCDDPVQPSDSK